MLGCPAGLPSWHRIKRCNVLRVRHNERDKCLTLHDGRLVVLNELYEFILVSLTLTLIYSHSKVKQMEQKLYSFCKLSSDQI